MWFGADAAKAGAAASKPRPFPIQSWGMFIFRDVLTVGAGFTFPAAAAAYLKENEVMSPPVADIFAQLTVPMAFQVGLTPIHLLALDIYNRPDMNMANRFKYIESLYLPSLFVRCARVGAVYGVAGVANKKIKSTLRNMAHDAHEDEMVTDIV
jgi:hypothetical protein